MPGDDKLLGLRPRDLPRVRVLSALRQPPADALRRLRPRVRPGLCVLPALRRGAPGAWPTRRRRAWRRGGARWTPPTPILSVPSPTGNAPAGDTRTRRAPARGRGAGRGTSIRRTTSRRPPAWPPRRSSPPSLGGRHAQRGADRRRRRCGRKRRACTVASWDLGRAGRHALGVAALHGSAHTRTDG